MMAVNSLKSYSAHIVRAAVIAAISTGFTVHAYADDDSVLVDVNSRPGPQRELSGVKAFANPLPAPNTANIRAEEASSQFLAGAKVAVPLPGERMGEATPRAFGSFGIPYATGRVALGATSQALSPNYLATTYPYRAIGKLTMSAGFCSASLIRRSVIVTAAHCIQNFGSGGSIFSNFQFTPSNYNPGATAAQRAPYGTWTWLALSRSTSWSNGTDTGSGAARANDLAVIVLSKNGAGQFIGNLTGYLGYGWNNYSFTSSSKTGNLAVAAIATLGYPALMDSGRRMQRADGPTYTTTISGAAQLWQGNNFTGGSSGGPWVVNFRAADPVLSGGAVMGTASTMAVVGVTSWGSADPNAAKDNYSSRFGQNTQFPAAAYGTYGAGNIGALLNSVCSLTIGGQSLATLGYCS